MASKRKILTLDQKVAVIQAIEYGGKKSHVGKRFGLSPSSVTTIWNSKDKILQAEMEGNPYKKLRKPKFEELDQSILLWFQKQRFNDVPISGTILKAKAQELAEQLGVHDFKASHGWLGKFKRRHNIDHGLVSREEEDNVINDASEELGNKSSFSDNFNAHETGLFKKKQVKTLKFRGEKRIRGKVSKEISSSEADKNDIEREDFMVNNKLKDPLCLKKLKQLPGVCKLKEEMEQNEEDEQEEVNDSSPSTRQALEATTFDLPLCYEVRLEEQNEEEKEEVEDSPPSIQQALDAAKLLQRFLLCHENEFKLSKDMDKICRTIEKYGKRKKFET